MLINNLYISQNAQVDFFEKKCVFIQLDILGIINELN